MIPLADIRNHDNYNWEDYTNEMHHFPTLYGNYLS